MTDTLIVLAKRPSPGRVKTRLTPPLTPQQAADVAAAALTDTLDAVGVAHAARRLLAFDGDETGWLRPAWTHIRQTDGGLDRRISHAFTAASGPSLLVGMDTPQLTARLLGQFDPDQYDACLGPAPDGGYWAIGFRDPAIAAEAVLGVPMSTHDTFERQHERLDMLGLKTQRLDVVRDVDTIHDARAVASIAPATTFARALARIGTPVA